MEAFADSYASLSEVVAGLDDNAAWAPTACLGWSVRDLLFHLHADCVRALVAVHSPADAEPDCDAVAYWRAWGSDPQADERSRRFTRLEAGLFGWVALGDRHVEAARAASHAVLAADPDAVVATQGHAIRVADLASTLAVEASLHHLDLVRHLSAAGPMPSGMAEVRRVVETLLGRSLEGWSDERVALVGTGRADATEAERGDLARVVLPVFT
jgi:hypothetical protein